MKKKILALLVAGMLMNGFLLAPPPSPASCYATELAIDSYYEAEQYLMAEHLYELYEAAGCMEGANEC